VPTKRRKLQLTKLRHTQKAAVQLLKAAALLLKAAALLLKAVLLKAAAPPQIARLPDSFGILYKTGRRHLLSSADLFSRVIWHDASCRRRHRY